MFYRCSMSIVPTPNKFFVPIEYKRLSTEPLILMPCWIEEDSLDILVACVGELKPDSIFYHNLDYIFSALQLKPIKKPYTFTAINADKFITYLTDTVKFYCDIKHIIDVSSLFVLQSYTTDQRQFVQAPYTHIEYRFEPLGKPRIIITDTMKSAFPYIKTYNAKKLRFDDGFTYLPIHIQESITNPDILFDPRFFHAVADGCLLISISQRQQTNTASEAWLTDVIIPQILKLSKQVYIIVLLGKTFAKSPVYDKLIANGIMYP